MPVVVLLVKWLVPYKHTHTYDTKIDGDSSCILLTVLVSFPGERLNQSNDSSVCCFKQVAR
jgi:hypothetical protein